MSSDQPTDEERDYLRQNGVNLGEEPRDYYANGKPKKKKTFQ